MLVDFASLAVLPQQPSQDSHPSEPLDFGGHTSLGGTLAFTVAGVTTETLGGVEVPRAGARVDDGGLDDAGMSVGSSHQVFIGPVTIVSFFRPRIDGIRATPGDSRET